MLRPGRLLALVTLAAAGAAPACASDNAVVCDTCPACPEPGVDGPACDPPPRPADAPMDFPAPASDRSRTLDLAGFSADGKHFALQSRDEAVGSAFIIYEAAKERPVDTLIYAPLEEKDTWRRVASKYKVRPLETASARANRHDVVLVGADTPEHVVIYAMRGERAVAWARIPRLATAEGTPAAVAVKRIAWSPNEDYAVVIHGQAMTDPLPFAADYVHIVRVDPAKLPF